MKLAPIPFIFLSIISIETTIGQITWEAVNVPTVGNITDIDMGPDNDIYVIESFGEVGSIFGEDSLMRSLDNGTSWNYINVGSSGVNDIFITSNGEYYIGAGIWGVGGYEPPGGIFYSPNGVDWEHLYKDEPGCGHIEKVYKNYQGDLLAITDFGGLYQLKAGEQTWDYYSCDFVEDPCQAPFFGVYELKIDTLNQYYISTTGGLYKSTDKGSTWTDLELEYEIHCTEVYDNLDIIAGTLQDGIFHFNDENDVWTNIGLKGRDIRTIYSQENSILFVATQDSGVYYTNNNGNTWVQLNQGLDTTSILIMKISPSGFFYISTGSKVYKSVESFDDIYQPTYTTGIRAAKENENVNNIFSQSYPNPFSGQTNITFNLKRPQNIRLAIYNSVGQLVEILVDEYRASGSHCEIWDAGINSPGIYYYRIETEEFNDSHRLILQ
jgi:photosystem II stability/assembly factor-like uncharacterized protein